MSEISFRTATKEDLPAIVAMLADDEFGETRETIAASVPDEYTRAFEEMSRDPNNRVLLAEQNGAVVGSLQLVFTPSLSRRGTKRATVEAVRIASKFRGQNIGTALMREAIGQSRKAGCGLVQVTSDKRRTRAHLFYRRLGFEQSHIGFKLELS
jgi:ribosomal protein S18 acetylase RimI-like enzyme